MEELVAIDEESPEKIEDAAHRWVGFFAAVIGEEEGTEDRLRSRQIRDQLIVADLLDDLDRLNAACRRWYLAGNGKDAATIAQTVWRAVNDDHQWGRRTPLIDAKILTGSDHPMGCSPEVCRKAAMVGCH
ncbi:hypothetical protein ACLOJK_018611 [Asimina triloba]